MKLLCVASVVVAVALGIESRECPARFGDLEAPPADPILGLKALYLADETPVEAKIDLSVGAYRDENGKPWVMPPVVEARARLGSSNMTHEYLPIDGLPAFNKLTEELIYGSTLASVEATTVQTLSGTGAARLALEFLNRYGPKTILIPDVTWPNHFNIARDAGYVGDRVQRYAYVDSTGRGLDWTGLLRDVKKAPRGSILMLHLCAHNPTGIDPTLQQWEELASVVEDRGLLPMFDSAYLGFATGDVDTDAAPFRLFVNRGLAPWATVSFSKNFGLYGERTGALHVTAASPQEAVAVKGNLKQLARAMYSNPPAYGARIVSTVLADVALLAQWHESLKVMSGRITEMRLALRSKLEAKNAPGTWEHITSQIGMFSFTGLSPESVVELREKHHVYMLANGRISMAGITPHNVDALADAIATTLKK